MNLDIYVPSYKRKDAPLIKKLQDAGLPFTIVLDHVEDVKDYANLESEKVKILFIERALGIGYVRQIGNIPDFKVDLKTFRKRYGYDY